MGFIFAASSARATDWSVVWSAVTAIATCVLVVSIPISAWALVAANRSNRRAHQEREERRWDSYLGTACIRFLQAQAAVMRIAERAHLSGEKAVSLDSAIERFEAVFIELELVAPNKLVKSAQLLWAQTVGTVTENGFNKKWPRDYAEDQRQAFLEQVRSQFGLTELYESSTDVIRRVEELNKKSAPHDAAPDH